MNPTQFAFPTAITFGTGARRQVADFLRARGCGRPLLVTDRALAALPVTAGFRNQLDGLDVAVYDGVQGNPTATQVMSGAEAFHRHGADGVIAFGGGAAMDVAKAVALMAVHPGHVLEYAWDHPEVRPIEHPLPCLVAVPTTAGTGSEVGRSAVVADDVSHVKRTLFARELLPVAVFADPELTLGLPAAITAATGMDALTHNIESYLSPAWHPMCDGIALEGLRIGGQALARAVEVPDDLSARTDMLMCSMMGAVAFQKDLGSVHACAHALGAVCDLHHGLANALMIEPVLRWNHEAVPDRFRPLAAAVGVADGAAFLDWIARLRERIGIRAGLAAHGVRESHLPELVRIAHADFTGRTNPRPAAAEDYDRLFREAL